MSLKKNVVANFIGQGWSALMAIAFLPIYIKYLGIEAYGLIGFYAALQAWFTLLDMGITQTLNREMARYTAGRHTSKSIFDLLRSLELISMVIGLFIFILVWQTSGLIAARWLNASSLSITTITNALAMMGFVIATRFIEGIYRGALLGLQKQVAVNLLNVVFSTLRFGGVVIVLHYYKSAIEVFFAWQSICATLSLALLAIFVYRAIPKPDYKPNFSIQALSKVKTFAAGMLGVTFLALLLTQIDKLLLSNLLPLRDYGIYVLASTVAGGLTLIATPTTQAFYPKLVEYVAQNNSEALIKAYHQGAQLISVVVIPTAAMLICFAEKIIFLWSGNQLLAQTTAPILIPLTLGTMLNCLVWMPYQLQLAYGWTEFAIKVNLVAVAVLVPAIIVITPSYGAIGAAWVWAILNIGYVAVAMHFLYRRLLIGEKCRWYLYSVISPLSISFIVVFSLKQLLPVPSNNLNAVLVVILIGAVTFISVIAALPTTRRKIVRHLNKQVF